MAVLSTESRCYQESEWSSSIIQRSDVSSVLKRKIVSWTIHFVCYHHVCSLNVRTVQPKFLLDIRIPQTRILKFDKNNSSIRNQTGELEYTEHEKRIVSTTVQKQLKIATHKISPSLSPQDLRYI